MLGWNRQACLAQQTRETSTPYQWRGLALIVCGLTLLVFGGRSPLIKLIEPLDWLPDASPVHFSPHSPVTLGHYTRCVARMLQLDEAMALSVMIEEGDPIRPQLVSDGGRRGPLQVPPAGLAEAGVSQDTHDLALLVYGGLVYLKALLDRSDSLQNALAIYHVGTSVEASAHGRSVVHHISPATHAYISRILTRTKQLRSDQTQPHLILYYPLYPYELAPLYQRFQQLQNCLPHSLKEFPHSVPAHTEWRGVGGIIHTSLYQSILQVGLPVQLLDAFSALHWPSGLLSGVQTGDSFKIVFEEIQRSGHIIGYGRVLAAELVHQGQTHRRFFMDTEPSGHQQFLPPVHFSRISSGFSTARFHPILKRRRPHLGVDFAAPSGTPVRAVADGRVQYAGWQGGFGKLVRLDHPTGHRSEYAHLQSFAKAIKTGRRVKQGELIGTVGATGLATGPHLHFGLSKKGTYMNPLTAGLFLMSADQHPADRAASQSPARAVYWPSLTEQKKSLHASLDAIALRPLVPVHLWQATVRQKPRLAQSLVHLSDR